MMKRILGAVSALSVALALASAALAQSGPPTPIYYGKVPTAGQINAWLTSKQDFLNCTGFLFGNGSNSTVCYTPATALSAILGGGSAAASGSNIVFGTTTAANAAYPLSVWKSYGQYVPSLSYHTVGEFSVDGGLNGELVFGLDSSSPFGFWMQGRTGAGTSTPLLLNPMGGNVGVGTRNPTALLTVAGSETLSASGNTDLVKRTTPASSLSSAGFNVPPGTCPTSPVNGDVCVTASGSFVYVNSGWVGIGPRFRSTTLVASPTAPASTAGFYMQGLAAIATPTASGTILITISGTIVAPSSTVVNNGIMYQIVWGTGTAPANAVAIGSAGTTRTAVGPVQQYTSAVAPTAAAYVHVPFSVSFLVTGLSLGTPYWVDLAAESVTTASGLGLSNVAVVIAEQ